jgi:TrmH family RNA methyltransferase
VDKKRIQEKLENFEGTHRDERFKNLTFTIILSQPETAGNVGQIARIMKNFNFEDLVIFNPIDSVENILSYETQGFAMHGKDILVNADIIELNSDQRHIVRLEQYLDRFDLIIGTTAKGKSHNNLNRLAIFPNHIELPESENPLHIAVLFGKESRGLTNDELLFTDILLRIPTSDIYPTLNLAQACGIILYELFKKLYVTTIGRGKNPVLLATKTDREILYSILKKLIKKFKIRNYRTQNAFLAFKNIIERSFISEKELSLITGFFSKIMSLVKDVELFEDDSV